MSLAQSTNRFEIQFIFCFVCRCKIISLSILLFGD
jgi:hypothetical protein